MSQMSLFTQPIDDGRRPPSLDDMRAIYRPAGRALEYSPLAVNVYRGCGHGCVYCFAPGATRRTREAFGKPTTRAGKFLAKVEKDAGILQANGIRGPVLLCFTTDPYQSLDRELAITRTVIQILHEHDVGAHILTKAGLAAWRDRDLIGQHPLDAAAATLTFTKKTDEHKWEPGAAPFRERVIMLDRFHQAGVRTWASCEPVIYPEQTLEAIEIAAPHVDEFRIGKTNHVGDCPPELAEIIGRINWSEFVNNAIHLCARLGKGYYIKKDLALYMTS